MYELYFPTSTDWDRPRPVSRHHSYPGDTPTSSRSISMANSPLTTPPAADGKGTPTDLPVRFPIVCPPRPVAMSGMELQPPLTHRGIGPGLIVILPPRLSMRPHKALGLKTPLDPEPVKKWAEEGYCVVGTRINGTTDVTIALSTAVAALEDCEYADTKARYAVLVYDPSALPSILAGSASMPLIVAIVSHGAASFSDEIPMLVHVPERIIHDVGVSPPSNCRLFSYGADSPYFIVPSAGPKAYSPANASVAHSRTLAFLREQLGGPYFDLEAIWDEHTHYEFVDRSVEKTMLTMVDEPYVNHVPTMTGGVGREALTEFYRDHFIFSNPDDADLLVVSRTVGADRVVDEFIYSCTHNRMIDWLLPGVPPTGKKIELPMMAVVNIRGDRLYHEHIWWDQASALQQVGYLPETVPTPHGALRLPVAGYQSAKMLVDETEGESNFMFGSEWGVQKQSDEAQPKAARENGQSSTNGH